VSRIHTGIRWTRVVISRGRKLTTTDAPLLHSLWGWSKTCPRELCVPGSSKRKKGEQTS